MLIDKLIQEVQACFRNPFRDTKDPIIGLVTRLYQENAQFVLNSPVSVAHGYGAAMGKNGTFKERIERFIRIIGASSDVLQALYAINMSEVAAMLFLYDIGAANVPIEKRYVCENDPSRLDICGQSVSLIMSAAATEQLGTSINGFIGAVTVLYKRLGGSTNLLSGMTEVVVAENIIRMDRLAIESIKVRIDSGIS